MIISDVCVCVCVCLCVCMSPTQHPNALTVTVPYVKYWYYSLSDSVSTVYVPVCNLIIVWNADSADRLTPSFVQVRYHIAKSTNPRSTSQCRLNDTIATLLSRRDLNGSRECPKLNRDFPIPGINIPTLITRLNFNTTLWPISGYSYFQGWGRYFLKST